MNRDCSAITLAAELQTVSDDILVTNNRYLRDFAK